MTRKIQNAKVNIKKNIKSRNCLNLKLSHVDFCNLDPPSKDCGITPENRWFYKAETGECGIFTYRGCGATVEPTQLNSFDTEEECTKTCGCKIKKIIRI